MGQYALILVAAGAFGFAIVQGSLGSLDSDFYRLAIERYDESVARQAANSMAHVSLATLSDSLYWRAGFGSVAAGGGIGVASIEDSGTDSTLGPARVRIRGSGSSGAVHDTAVVVAIVPFWPGDVDGAITARRRSSHHWYPHQERQHDAPHFSPSPGNYCESTLRADATGLACWLAAAPGPHRALARGQPRRRLISSTSRQAEMLTWRLIRRNPPHPAMRPNLPWGRPRAGRLGRARHTPATHGARARGHR